MATLSDLEIREYNEAVLMRIREICIRRNSSITKIEKALGYGNGSVSGWKNAKRKAPLERVVAIAEYLNVPVVALTGDLPAEEELKKEQPALSEKRQAALEILEKLSDAQVDALLKLLGE